MGLYCLRALRGLWGFCVREWLGGFGACGVFCLSFLLLSSCPLVRLSSCSPALLLLLVFGVACVVVVGFLSLSDYTQKRAQFLASSLVLLCVAGQMSLNITVISCGSSWQYLIPLQVIPATSLGCFVG